LSERSERAVTTDFRNPEPIHRKGAKDAKKAFPIVKPKTFFEFIAAWVSKANGRWKLIKGGEHGNGYYFKPDNLRSN
jgi:hypothetical protein